MKIWLFYAKWKVCFPHVWQLTHSDEIYDYYECAVCKKTKKKKRKINKDKNNEG